MTREELIECIALAATSPIDRTLPPYKRVAVNILAALKARGMVIVPMEATPEMCEAHYALCKQEGTLAVSASEIYRAMTEAYNG